MASDKWIGRLGKSILTAALVGSGLAGSAAAASRSATTTIAVRVERHVGLLLPTSTGGITYASLESDRIPEGPTAFGNGSSRVMLSAPSGSTFTPVARQSSSVRVEVTVFEP